MYLVDVKLFDGHFSGLGKGEVSKEDVRAEGEGVHVLRPDGVDFAGLDQLSALGFGLI